ncbi:MAG: DUF2203 domain-containing protein [Actinomycetota bacterium]
MAGKLYTPAEANALLPYVAPLLVELREKFEEAAAIREKVATAAAGNGWSPTREEWARTLARVGELIDKLQKWSVELRDVTTGLVDFPTVMEGREAYLCWRLGEEDVAHWHFPEEGFPGRHPL